jgi:N-acyl-D-aspartate/D-glutamate deacylase
VIDFDNLSIAAPELRYDLPTDASRILQAARGYVATMVAGTVIRSHDADTGERPGRLVRGPRTAP